MLTVKLYDSSVQSSKEMDDAWQLRQAPMQNNTKVKNLMTRGFQAAWMNTQWRS